MTYFDPERPPQFPAYRRTAARRQLEQIVENSAAPSRRIRPVVIAAGAGAIVLTTGAAAFAVAEYQPVTDQTQARCYMVADPASSAYTTVAEAARPGSPAQVRNALAVCAALYRQGFLRVGARHIDDHPGDAQRRVPALAVCAMTNGTAAVFPGGRGTCERLGLSAATKPERAGG